MFLPLTLFCMLSRPSVPHIVSYRRRLSCSRAESIVFANAGNAYSRLSLVRSRPRTILYPSFDIRKTYHGIILFCYKMENYNGRSSCYSIKNLFLSFLGNYLTLYYYLTLYCCVYCIFLFFWQVFYICVSK